MVGDSAPGWRNGVFSRPPLALGFGREPAGGATELPGGEWLGLSVRALMGDLRFSTLRYEPLDASGRPVSADPANPAYRRRLIRIAEALLSEQGLDADGFMVDFTQRAPNGKTLAATEGAWGVAGLHLLMSTLYRAAKAAKPDALVMPCTRRSQTPVTWCA